MRAWSRVEERRLVLAYEAGVSMQRIASDHLRTERAIATRVLRLGLHRDGPAPVDPAGEVPLSAQEIDMLMRQQRADRDRVARQANPHRLSRSEREIWRQVGPAKRRDHA